MAAKWRPWFRAPDRALFEYFADPGNAFDPWSYALRRIGTGPRTGMNAEHLKTIAAFSGADVAVLGDVMLDRVVQGGVSRISPEAPIPVLHVERETATLGGAGNVAANIARLGGRATLIGVIGQDEAASTILKIAAGEKNITVALTRYELYHTVVKTRFIAQGQQLLRVDHEMPTPVSVLIADQLLGALRQALCHSSVVILSDYAKGVLSQSVTESAIAMAHAAGIAVIVDPKSPIFRAITAPTLLHPMRAKRRWRPDLPVKVTRKPPPLPARSKP